MRGRRGASQARESGRSCGQRGGGGWRAKLGHPAAGYAAAGALAHAAIARRRTGPDRTGGRRADCAPLRQRIRG
eukprot:11194758-Lingulodinium_polyedra.AAC.1